MTKCSHYVTLLSKTWLMLENVKDPSLFPTSLTASAGPSQSAALANEPMQSTVGHLRGRAPSEGEGLHVSVADASRNSKHTKIWENCEKSVRL